MKRRNESSTDFNHFNTKDYQKNPNLPHYWKKKKKKLVFLNFTYKKKIIILTSAEVLRETAIMRPQLKKGKKRKYGKKRER